MNKFLFFVTYFAILLLSACGTTNSSSEDPSLIVGKIENYTGGEAELIAVDRLESLRFDGGNAGIGSVTSDGSFQLELLSNPEAGVGSFCDQAQVSTPDFNFYPVSELYVRKNGSVIGYILQTSVNPVSRQVAIGDKQTLRFYVDKDLTATGKCAPDQGGSDLRLNLKKGWNIVVAEVTAQNETRVSTASSTGNLRWYFQSLD